MAEYILRPACERDKEKIIEIFQASFGDGEAFVREITDRSQLLSSACCAEMEGEIRSCMFAFHGIELKGQRFSYLYALCTEPSYRSRGLGRAVTQYSARCAFDKGAEGVFLLAANEALQDWYMSAMGAVPMLAAAPMKYKPFSSREKATVLSPEEYLSLRSGEWHLPRELIIAQDCVNRHFGGAFLRLGDDCLCAEMRENGLLVRELSARHPEALLSAASNYFGVDELDILRPAKDGKSLLFLPPAKVVLPESTPAFPILLD